MKIVSSIIGVCSFILTSQACKSDPARLRTTTTTTTAKPCLPVSVVRGDHGIWDDIPEESFSVEKLLTNSNLEIFGENYWLAEDRSSAEFVLDLGCEKRVNTVELVNTKSGHHENRGTKQFSVSISLSSEAPWEQVLQASLADPRAQTDPLPLQTFRFPEMTARFVQFNLSSWYGWGGGLQYFRLKEAAGEEGDDPPAAGQLVVKPSVDLSAQEAREAAEEIRIEGEFKRFGFAPVSPEKISLAARLVREGYLASIEEIRLTGIDLSSLPTEDLATLLSVVRNSVRLGDVELSAGQTFTVLRSLSTITEGLHLNNNVVLHTETLEKISELTGEVRGRFVVCWGNSAVSYRAVMQRWAGILGWQYKDGGNFFEIRRD